MDASLEDLTLRFQIDVKSTMEFCEKVICDDKFNSLSDYISYQQSILPPNCCQYTWKDLTVVAICKECMRTKNSCICLGCFLRGHHKGHNASFMLSTVGNCDCGDPVSWSHLGFCNDHFQHKSVDLPKNLTEFLTNTFTASLRQAHFLGVHKTDTFFEICCWIKRFADINESFKNCVARVFSENYFNLTDFLRNFHVYQSKSVMAAIDLLSSLTNNMILNKVLTKSVYEFFPEYVWMLLSAANEEQPKKRPMEQLFFLYKIMSYAFMHGNVKEALTDGIEWVQMCINTLRLIFEYISRDYNSKLYEHAKVEQIFQALMDLISGATEEECQRENLINFSRFFFENLLDIEGKCKFHIAVDEKEDDPLKKETTVLHLIFCLADLIRKMFMSNVDEENCCTTMMGFLESNIWNDSFDTFHDQPIYDRSTLNPGVYITALLPIHISFQKLLMKQSNQREFMRILNEQHKNIPRDEFLMSFCLLPLRYFAVYLQSNTRLFEKNCASFLTAIKSFSFKGNIELRLMPLFGLIQMIFGLIENKEFAVKSVFNIFGLNEIENPKDYNFIMFLFLGFVTNLVTDRICITHDIPNFAIKMMAIALEEKNLSYTEIESIFWPELLQASFFPKAVESITERIESDSETKFKLSDKDQWTPFGPWLSINSTLKVVSTFIQKNRGKLIPFQKFSEEPYSLNLRGLLITRTLFAIVYNGVSSQVHETGSSIVTLHLLLNLIIMMRQVSEKVSYNSDFVAEIDCENLEELMEIIPPDFDEMIHCEIRIGKRPRENLIQLLEQVSELGKVVLIAINEFISEDETKIIDDESIILKKKAAAAEAKRNALKQIQLTTPFNDFKESDDTDIEESAEMCSICQTSAKKEILWYPMTIFRSNISTFASKESNWSHATDITALICTHVVHSKCIKELGPYRNFQCSTDRCIKNCLLPKLPAEFNSAYEDDLELFAELFSAHTVSSGKENSVLISVILELFIGLLTTIEFRDRSNPFFSGKVTNSLLLKYLFRTIWYLQTIKKQQLREKSSPIWLFVSQLINADNPRASFDVYLLIFKKLLKDEDIFVFYRQIAILQVCVFGIRVKIPESNGLKKNIMDVDYPDMFFEYILPKYGSIPADKYYLNIGICLLTGKLVYTKKHDETPPTAIELDKHVKDNCRGLCPVMMLTNEYATAVYIYSDTFPIPVKLRPFYLTKNGDENVGLNSNSAMMPLYLCKEMYNRTMDLIFSGEWLWSLESKEFVDCLTGGRLNTDENDHSFVSK